MRKWMGVTILWLMTCNVYAQTLSAEMLFLKLRQKVDAIKDYEANVRMKIDVSFMRVPPLSGKLYFKAPDKMKMERNGGISIWPRKSMNITMSSLLPAAGATVIDAGKETVNSKSLRMIKVIPGNEESNIVLTKIWVDEQRLLPIRTETTTRDNGTVKMELDYEKFEKQGLPDRVVFYIDTKEFKLPKGVTMDYDGADKQAVQKPQPGAKPRKGRIEINYSDYKINKGLPDALFIENKK